ncbi:MAG: glycosyltransferase family 4 protein [Ruminococcaceae bacterium]|nr:glycosyltransferase family 4 protein [Oscillospiraceae bacterium]
MKKILINIGRLSNGGAERVVALWAGILAQRGYDVSLYISHRDEDEYHVNPRVRIESTASSQKDLLDLSLFKRIKKHRDYIKKFQPDVMINFLPGIQVRMLVISMGLKLRIIETVRNNPWIDADIGRTRPIWNLCFKKADAIIIQTEEQAEYFSMREKRKCTVIRNPISVDCINASRTEYAEKATRFMVAGRLAFQKNLPMLIEAFAMVSKENTDIFLDIVGKGTDDYTAFIQRCIDNSGMASRITMRGSTNDICDALLRHDCFILSSDYEGMPNALAEAMATGMVCISTDCKTGPSDMIEDGVTGFLVKTGDAQSMAKAIETVVSMSREQRKEMGCRAKQSILSLCDDETNIKKLIEVIEGE